MVKVMVFGTFDILHPGHFYFLKKAKKYGDELIVVVARDSTIKKVKGKEPKYNERERLENLRSLSFVNKVVLGNENDKYKVIEEIVPDTICLGYDQEPVSIQLLKNKLEKRGINPEIHRIDAYKEHIYKSSKLND
jgi:FAD synthetase